MKRLFNKIKKFADKISVEIKKAWNKLDDEAKEHIIQIIQIVQAIKNTIEKGTFTGSLIDIAVEKTPFDWDNIALQKIRKSLPELLVKLTYANIIVNAGTTENQIAKAIELIQVFDDVQKETFWDDFAKELLKASSDGHMSWSEVNGMVKIVYDELYKKD